MDCTFAYESIVILENAAHEIIFIHVMFTCQVKNQQVLEWSQVLMTTDVVVLPCMHVHSLSI